MLPAIIKHREVPGVICTGELMQVVIGPYDLLEWECDKCHLIYPYDELKRIEEENGGHNVTAQIINKR
jgi:hypothetical protein